MRTATSRQAFARPTFVPTLLVGCFFLIPLLLTFLLVAFSLEFLS
jgi:hypothetical protein